MLTYSGKLQGVLRNHQAVYSFMCIGITSSLIFWPLLSSIFCVLLLIYWVVCPGKKFSVQSFSSRRLILFSALYLPVILGCLYSADKNEATFLLQQKSPLLVFPIVFGTLPILTPLLKRKIFWTLIFSTTIGCLLGLTVGTLGFFANGSTYGLHGYALVVLKNMHPAIFGLCCLLSIGYLFEELRLNGKQMDALVKKGCVGLIVFLMLFLCLMGNRNNLICLTIITLLFIFRILPDISHRLVACVTLMCIWLCSLLTVPAFKEHWKELVNETSKARTNHTSVAFPDSRTARLKIWNSVLDVIGSNLILGVGSGDSQAELERSFNEKNYAFASYNHCNAHNQYLQETLAFGIPGLVIFVLCLLIPFASFLHSNQQFLYCIFLILISFVCLSESILQLSKGIIWYSFFNAVFAFTAAER